MRRCVIISDTHCGHRTGLTPPDWQLPKRSKWGHIQYRAYVEYLKMVKKFYQPDLLLVNGDAVDWPTRNRGGEYITLDFNEMVKMSVECIKVWDADKVYMTRGTPRHVGTDFDLEDLVAERVGATIADQLFLNVEDVILDAKHHISKAQISLSRHIENNRKWASMKNPDGEGVQPFANILLRSHLHQFRRWKGGGFLDCEGIVTPGLQSLGQSYAKQLTDPIHWGIVTIDIDGKRWDIQEHLCNFIWQAEKPEVVKFL